MATTLGAKSVTTKALAAGTSVTLPMLEPVTMRVRALRALRRSVMFSTRIVVVMNLPSAWAKESTFSSVMLSEDRGETWRYVETPAGLDTTECALVELTGGSWMLNLRDNRNRRNRDRQEDNAEQAADTGEAAETASGEEGEPRARGRRQAVRDEPKPIPPWIWLGHIVRHEYGRGI